MHRSTCGAGFGPKQKESLCNVANVCDSSNKILHRYCFVRMPSPHVTLHDDQCVSFMKLKKENKNAIIRRIVKSKIIFAE